MKGWHNQGNYLEVLSRLQAIIQNAIDGIITIDEQGVIETVNPAAARIFGYNNYELIGRNVSVLMPSPDRERHDQYIHNYTQTGVPRIIGIGREVMGLRKDGSQFPFRLSVSEVHLTQRRIFTGIIHDVSEQKRAEEEIRQLNIELENRVAERTEKLAEVVNKLLATNKQLQHEIQERKAAEEALRKSQKELEKALIKEKELSELKSRFVSMASHEFRTPLSTILSSAALIGRYATEEQQPQREKHVNKIKSAVENLTGILNDFLSLSKLEEGKVELQPDRFLVNVFLEDVVDEMQGLVKPAQELCFHGPLPQREIVTDKRLLKNILFNLISNAIKYSEKGRIEITCELNSRLLYISVVDHGIGIPDEDKPHMFTRFFRATNASNIKGTGLGLNIVKRYVELLDGDITFQSELGKGTTFMVWLPVDY